MPADFGGFEPDIINAARQYTAVRERRPFVPATFPPPPPPPSPADFLARVPAPQIRGVSTAPAAPAPPTGRASWEGPEFDAAHEAWRRSPDAAYWRQQAGGGSNSVMSPNQATNHQVIPGDAAASAGFRGQAAPRFRNPAVAPHATPAPGPAEGGMPQTQEALTEYLAKMGFGSQAQPEGGGFRSRIHDFFKNDAGAFAWPPTGTPGGADDLVNRMGLSRDGSRYNMRPGPAPRGPAAVLPPGDPVPVGMPDTEARLDRMIGPERATGPATPPNRRPAIPTQTEPNMAAMRELHGPLPVEPTATSANPLPRAPAMQPGADPAAYRQTLAQFDKLPRVPAAVEPVAPPIRSAGRFIPKATRVAGGLGAAAALTAAADPVGFAGMVGHPLRTASDLGGAIWSAPGKLFSPEFARGVGVLTGSQGGARAAEGWHALNNGANPAMPLVKAASNAGGVIASGIRGTLGQDFHRLSGQMSDAFNGVEPRPVPPPRRPAAPAPPKATGMPNGPAAFAGGAIQSR